MVKPDPKPSAAASSSTAAAGGAKAAADSAAGRAGKVRPKKKSEPWVVIVANAEADLSTIHAEAVCRFVLPRADKADAVPADSRTPSVVVREETLTALVRYDPRAYSQSKDEIAEAVSKRVSLGLPVRLIARSSDRSANLQARLARATLSTSRNVTAAELDTHLKDVPGFVSCRRVRAQVFHAVFADDAALMNTKALLDEFESDGLRIKVQLDSQREEAYDAFLRERAEGIVDLAAGGADA